MARNCRHCWTPHRHRNCYYPIDVSSNDSKNCRRSGSYSTTNDCVCDVNGAFRWAAHHRHRTNRQPIAVHLWWRSWNCDCRSFLLVLCSPVRHVIVVDCFVALDRRQSQVFGRFEIMCLQWRWACESFRMNLIDNAKTYHCQWCRCWCSESENGSAIVMDFRFVRCLKCAQSLSSMTDCQYCWVSQRPMTTSQPILQVQQLKFKFYWKSICFLCMKSKYRNSHSIALWKRDDCFDMAVRSCAVEHVVLQYFLEIRHRCCCHCSLWFDVAFPIRWKKNEWMSPVMLQVIFTYISMYSFARWFSRSTSRWSLLHFTIGTFQWFDTSFYVRRSLECETFQCVPLGCN